jgi:hypothetical protein
MFAWLLPLAGLPIVFHLFLRTREKTRLVSSLMFFLRADPRHSRRKRLREWLILALRVLVILLFLLALARPVIQGGLGSGRLAIVMVLDNSASMGRAAAGGRSLLDEAVAGARRLIADLRPEDEAGLVLLAEDPAVALPPALTGDRAALLAVLESVRVTAASGEPGRALERAIRLAESGAAPRAMIPVWTDLQRAEWNRSAVAPAPSLRNPAVLVLRLERSGRAEADVAIQSVALPTRRIVAGLPALAEVGLRNAGAQAAQVRLLAAGEAAQSGSSAGGMAWDFSLAPAEDRLVPVTLPTEAPGWRWLELRLVGDDVASDNRSGLAYCVQPRPTILFAGARADFGLLPAALSPSGTPGFNLEFLPLTELAVRVQEPAVCLAVLMWRQVRELGDEPGGDGERLQKFVSRGGNLLIVCEAAGSPVDGPLPAWLEATPGPLAVSEKGHPLRPEAGHPLLEELRDERGGISLGGASVFRHQPLHLSTNWTAVLTLEPGGVALAGRTLGNGSVFACGLAWTTDWSTLPLKGAFVALAHNLALAGPGEMPGMRRTLAPNPGPLSAGARPALPGADEPVLIRGITGDPLTWKGRADDVPSLPRPGVYEVAQGTSSCLVAVRPEPAEAIRTYLPGPPIPALGSLTYTVEDCRDADTVAQSLARARRALDLSLPCLLLALAVLAAEAWLATRPTHAVPDPGVSVESARVGMSP